MTVDLYILAAGRSVRMGRPKPLVELGGISLLERAIRAGQASSARSVTVVTGSSRQEVEEQAAAMEAGTTWNRAYRDGLSGSIAAAVRHAGLHPDPASSLILAGCDQPFLTAGLLNRLAAAACDDPDRAVACGYAGTVGVPALFPSGWWPELLDLYGDKGAKTVLQRHSRRLVQVDWPQGGINVNRSADLASIDPASLPDPGNSIMVV